MSSVIINRSKTPTRLKPSSISIADLNKGFLLSFVLGLIDGLKALPKELNLIAYLLLSIGCTVSVLKKEEQRFFRLFPYLLYGELYVRDAFTSFPYNYLTYLCNIIFIIALIQQKISTGRHSAAYFFLAGYTALEFIDLARATDIQYAWMQFSDSLMLLLMVVWGSYNFLSGKRLNRFLTDIQMAGVFTCGYLAVAHLTGQITYGHVSNADASNGLPPNQLSTYLGFPCILFAFAILRSNKNFIVNLIFLVLSCTLMTFTFSRGGIYFLIALIGTYLFLNIKKQRSYSMLIVLVPIGFAIYLYILGATNGMLAERYQESGYSGRDRLATASVQLFLQHPLVGVGTSNFNALITEEGLYQFTSGAHNEITRAMAEHGVLGIVFFWGFFVMLFIEILQRSKIQRDYSIYFLLLFLLSIVHNGLKTGLQCLLLLLAVALPTVAYTKKKDTSPSLLLSKQPKA